MVSFNTIPNNLREPFVAVEFDGSKAQQGPSVLAYRGLLIGQKTSAGTAADNSLHRVTEADTVATLAGRGSILHRQAVAWFAGNKSTEVWILVVADASAGVQATGTIVVAGPATESGTINLYIGGQLVQVAVTSGDASTAIAAAINTAVNAADDLLVTSGVVSSTVTLTARNKGLHGNEIDVRVNYQDGEETPAGVTLTITAMGGVVAGATNPTLTTAIAALGDSWFHVVAHPWTDATSLTALEAELASRWGPMRQIDGVMLTAKDDTYANVSSLGNSRNSKHSVILRTNDSPTPPCEYAAHEAAIAAYHSQIDPARPLQTLELPHILAPAEADLDTLQERNLLLYDGISTTRVAAGGVVQISRLITTYKTNAAGGADPAYLNVETLFTLMYLRYSLRNRIQTRYPRHKLANDGTRVGAGQAVMTPLLMKAECLLWFREMEALGLVEGFDQFKADLVVERNATDPDRLDMLVPPDLINQLIVTAARIEFRK